MEPLMTITQSYLNTRFTQRDAEALADLNKVKQVLVENNCTETDRITIIGCTIFASFTNTENGKRSAEHAAQIMEANGLQSIHTYLGHRSQRLIVQAFR